MRPTRSFVLRCRHPSSARVTVLFVASRSEDFLPGEQLSTSPRMAKWAFSCSVLVPVNVYHFYTSFHHLSDTVAQKKGKKTFSQHARQPRLLSSRLALHSKTAALTRPPPALFSHIPTRTVPYRTVPSPPPPPPPTQRNATQAPR